MHRHTVIRECFNKIGEEGEIHQFDSLANVPVKKVTDFRSGILKAKPRIYNSLFKQWKKKKEKERKRERGMKKRSKASERRCYNIFDSFCRKDPRLGTTNAWKSNSIPDHTSLQRLRPKVSRFHCPRAFHTSEYIYASWFKKKKRSLLFASSTPPPSLVLELADE